MAMTTTDAIATGIARVLPGCAPRRPRRRERIAVGGVSVIRER
jgi:hypothetical protein